MTEIAFQTFKEIDVLPDVQSKHRAWLKNYQSLNYSIAEEGRHLIKWASEPKKYFDKQFSSEINMIARKPNRLVIEFDGTPEANLKWLAEVKQKLKELGAGYIQSTHKGKSDYLWIEFNRAITDAEAKKFLFWIAPEGSEIDLNFASSKKVFPVLFAIHWKLSYERELPIEYFTGSKIDYDILNIPRQNIKVSSKNQNGFNYQTAEKDISEIPKISYPKVSLEVYRKKLHEWFYFQDDEIIDIQLAVLIGEKIPGEPLWLFLIAPPGALKTENLRSFSFGDDFYPLSDLTSKTFVSGLMLGKGASRRKIEDLLPQLNKKVLIFKDFTTILEKSSDERAEIFAQLREIYDGSFVKKFGSIDKAIRYNSRFGLLAGVTPIVDKYWKLMQQLGERFLKVRWNEDINLTTTRARQNEGKENQMREEISRVAMGFISNLDFSKVPEFDDDIFGSEIDEIAKFVAIVRTPITIQDFRTDFYYDYIPMPERPTRIVKQLKKLARCLALVRNETDVTRAEMETIRRVAQDTAPPDRVAILRKIAEISEQNISGCPRNVLFSEIKLPESSVLRILEQLKMLDLIQIRIEETQTGYVSQKLFYYKVCPFIKDVLYPPTFTAPYSKKSEGITNKINFSELDKEFPK